MAEFLIRNLSAFGYAQGVTLWCYRIDPNGGRVADTLEPGFFDSALADKHIAAGDPIHVVGAGEGALLAVRTVREPEAAHRVIVELMCGTAGAVR